MSSLLVAAAPATALIVLAAWGGWLRKRCQFELPDDPIWPFAGNAGLALELADSAQFVDGVLGRPDTREGPANRRIAVLFQYLDFVFIPLYAIFFIVSACVLGDWPWFLPATVCVLLAAGFDVIEDLRILRMVRGDTGSPAKPFGQLKWLFYFATVAAEGLLFFRTGPTVGARAAAGMVLGAFLIATAVGGAVSSLKGSFTGIMSATKLSALFLIGLAAAPLVAIAPFSWSVAAEYAFLMRVPLLVGVLLLALPFLAFFTGARSLLQGLFDLTPWSLFVATLASMAVSGAVCMAAYIVLKNAYLRVGVPSVPTESLPAEWEWLLIMGLMSLPAMGFSVWFSAKQGHGLGRGIISALGGGGLSICLAWVVMTAAGSLGDAIPLRLENWLASTGLFSGYVLANGGPDDPSPVHLAAAAAFLCTLAVYVIVGIYGWSRLGKSRTVPALCSALMLLTMLTWMLSATAFFFDAWRVPVLLIVVGAGALTAQSVRSDHFYHLRKRETERAAPDPVETIMATGSRRVVVAAANGGGIQAGAWAAQVLQGLYEDCGEAFPESLRMISSVSGGSAGTAFFVHWLANRNEARPPAEAAAESSLDEVAWGLGWPDFLRGLAPWIFGWLIGRGRALEKAWCLSAAPKLSERGDMDQPLSNWNEKVAAGKIPAVVLNATIAETGQRLLLATTRLGQRDAAEKARVDATELHTINGQRLDVGVVTAARLSASFPYVTPASRSDGPGPQPHVVDGGYYDNYGMATMVEWLDEALTGAQESIQSVLVLQIHGAPVKTQASAQRDYKQHGWFYQALAPLTTLAAVREAGQVAHNDIELEFLQGKWAAAGVDIQSVTFEFPGEHAPLSWHLTPEEKDAICKAWSSEDMGVWRRKVKAFLAAGAAA
ncbi:MAG: patatin-like phospholipase family protein [Bryobacteraceae bacterium]|jgi:hypothetical protein